MGKRRALQKVVDEEDEIRCFAGPGLIREEVWIDRTGKVARYNLAFVNHHIFASDHGRVLGYDNQHGHHHRHYRGKMDLFAFTNYKSLLDRFIQEVEDLRKGDRA